MICRFIAPRLILMSIFKKNITQCGEILHISCESFSKNIAATNPLPSTRLGSEICTFEVNTYKCYKFK